MDMHTGEGREIEKGLDQFSTPYKGLKTAELNVQFTLDPTFGLSRKQYGWYSNEVLFDDTFFTEAQGTIDIETSATSGDVARLRSAYPGQYVSQTLAEPGMGMIIPSEHIERDENNRTSLTHGEISAELVEWDEATNSGINALGLSFEADGTYVQIRRGDNDTRFVHQKDWNIDPMDGTGPSGRILKPENGYVYNFPFTWYNQGAVYVVVYDAEVERYIPVHRATIDGELLVGTANLPMQITVENKTTADPLGCRVGGMQYSTYGGGVANQASRVTQETRHTTSDTLTDTVVTSENAIDPFAEPGYPLVAVRRDINNLESRASLSVRIRDLFINVDQDVWLFIFDEFNESSALTNQNFTQPVSTNNSSETRIQTDTSATDYTPSADSTLRSIQYVSTGQKEVKDISGEGTSQIPLEAATVVTAALTQGSNNTDAQPFLINFEEGF